jgi:hypothetical protein
MKLNFTTFKYHHAYDIFSLKRNLLHVPSTIFFFRICFYTVELKGSIFACPRGVMLDNGRTKAVSPNPFLIP